MVTTHLTVGHSGGPFRSGPLLAVVITVVAWFVLSFCIAYGAQFYRAHKKSKLKGTRIHHLRIFCISLAISSVIGVIGLLIYALCSNRTFGEDDDDVEPKHGVVEVK